MQETYKKDTLHICAQGQYFIQASDGKWFAITEGKGIHVQSDQVPEPLFEVTQAYPQKGECWLATNGLTYQVDVSETPTGYARASLRGEVSRDASSVYGLQKAEGKEKDIHLASRIYPDEGVSQEVTARYPQEGEVWEGSDGHRYAITRSEYGATRCTAIRVGEQKSHPLTSAHGKEGDKFPTETILLRCVDKAMPQEMPAPQIGEVWEGADGNEYTIYFFVDTEPSIPRVFAKDDSVHRATWGNFPMQLPVHLVKRKHLPRVSEAPEEEAPTPEVAHPKRGEIWETKSREKVFIRARAVDKLGHVLGSFCKGPERNCLFAFASPSTPLEHRSIARAVLVRRVSEAKERPLADGDGHLEVFGQKEEVAVKTEKSQEPAPSPFAGQVVLRRDGAKGVILETGLKRNSEDGCLSVRWDDFHLFHNADGSPRTCGEQMGIEKFTKESRPAIVRTSAIKVGQKYKDRRGNIWSVTEERGAGDLFVCQRLSVAQIFTKEGNFFINGEASHCDLMELVEQEPQVLGELSVGLGTDEDQAQQVEPSLEADPAPPAMAISLQVGKRYRTRGGHVVQVVSKGDTWHEECPFSTRREDDFSHWAYAGDGCERLDKDECSHDLVEELPDADGNALPEHNIIVAHSSEKARFSSFEDALAYSRTLGGAILQEGQGDDYGYWFVYLVTATLR